VRASVHRIVVISSLLLVAPGVQLMAWSQQPSAPSVEVKPTGDGVMVVKAKESITSLSLEGSELKPEAPLEGGVDKTTDFTRELVRVQWRPNDPIDLYIVRPIAAKKPPVVLYLYSFPNDIDRFRDNRFCQRITQSGAAAVGFVSTLTGERIRGLRPVSQWFV